MRLLRVLFAALAVGLFAAGAAGAQGALLPGMAGSGDNQAEAPPAPSPNDLRELMRLLSDDSVVAWLRANAAGGAADAAAAQPQSLRDEMVGGLEEVQTRLRALADAWRLLPAVPDIVARAWEGGLGDGEALRSITYVLIFLFVGAGLEWLYWQYMHTSLIQLEYRTVGSLRDRVVSAAYRFLLIGAALGLFAVGSLGTFVTFDWPPLVENIVLDLLFAVIAVRALASFSNFMLSPRVSDLRLVPTSGYRARRFHRWIVWTGSAAIFGMAACDMLERLAGVTIDPASAAHAVLSVKVVVAALVTLLAIAMIWKLNADTAARGRARFTPRSLNLVLFTALAIAIFALWLIDARKLMWTVAIVGLLGPAAIALRQWIDHLYDRAEEAAALEPEPADAAPEPEPAEAVAAVDAGEISGAPGDAEAAIAAENALAAQEVATEEAAIADGPETHRYDTYRPIVRRLARIVLIILAVLALGAAWGVNILSLSESPTMAGRLAGVAIDILGVALVADLVWTWAKTAIDRRLADYVPPEPGQAPGPEARMATLLPIFRKVLLATVLVMVGLTVLSSLGINVGPLLAGAGIVGIAIGFGAQALVRDIVSGVFFLLDDAFRVGEYIEMGELRGTVESISLRSLRVRHHLGAVHTIPFGELKSLTNYSRDWVIMKMEFRVPFETDLKLVKKIVKQVGAELQANEAYGHQLLQPLKSQGVRRMEEFNMVVGVKFMARPGAQWLIRRDAYQKIRDAFDQNGIVFAQRNVKVEVIGDRPMDDATRQAVVGAAQDAVEQRMEPAAVKDEP